MRNYLQLDPTRSLTNNVDPTLSQLTVESEEHVGDAVVTEQNRTHLFWQRRVKGLSSREYLFRIVPLAMASSGEIQYMFLVGPIGPRLAIAYYCYYYFLEYSKRYPSLGSFDGSTPRNPRYEDSAHELLAW